jgi:hypothetical protein
MNRYGIPQRFGSRFPRLAIAALLNDWRAGQDESGHWLEAISLP